MYCTIQFQTEFLGRSGIVRIDGTGERTDFEADILQIRSSHDDWGSIHTVGSWSSREGLMWQERSYDFSGGKILFNNNTHCILHNVAQVISSIAWLIILNLGLDTGGHLHDDLSTNGANRHPGMKMSGALRKKLRRSPLIITTVLVSTFL